VGRVVTESLGKSRVCTATLIGKYHILTASGCAMWTNYIDDSPPEPMMFQPGYNLGEKYANAYVIRSFWIKKVSLNAWETTNSEDFLVGILDRDMSVNGYFGLAKYNSSFNGAALWDMTSYPADLDSYARTQVTQGQMAVNVVGGEGTSSELYYMDGIVTHAGDFGAPIYSWLGNSYRLIGIVGVQNPYPTKFTVWVQGGSDLWNLIAQALEAYP
jgi:hypothetical protein